MVAVVFALVYWRYLDTQTWPGAFAVNVPSLGSILSIISAGVLQANAEARLIRAQPARFPPPVSKYVKEAFAEWRSGRSGMSLYATIRTSLDAFDVDSKARGGGVTMALTNITLQPAPKQQPELAVQPHCGASQVFPG
jgi:hypothetical protein